MGTLLIRLKSNMKKTMLGTICHSDLTLTSDIEKLFKVIVHGVPASTLCV